MSDRHPELVTPFPPLPGGEGRGEGERKYSTTKSVLCRALVLGLFLVEFPAHAAAPTESPRERISIDADWRFTKGDPTNNTVSLLYDERKSQNLRRFTQEADGNAAINQSVTNETTNAAAFIK